MSGTEGYEFGNARVRAMRSRLLHGAELTTMLASPTVETLLLALIETAYRAAVEAALLRKRGLAAVNEALQRDLLDTVGKLPGFYLGEAEHMIALALGKYEIHNVITVLRGIVQEAPASETAVLLLPVGGLRPAELRELARAPDLRGALNVLSTWQSTLAVPLLQATAARPGAGLPFLELALNCWYYNTLAEFATNSQSWHTTMTLETDVNNLLLALRLAGHPRAVATLQEEEPGAGWSAFDRLFCGVGTLSAVELGAIARQPTLSAALALLSGTAYGPLLAAARSAPSPSLAAVERDLLDYQLHKASQVYGADPLGIGVPLGYIRMKIAEIINLRLIAQAVVLDLDRTWARSQLLLRPDQAVEVRAAGKAAGG